MFFFPFQYCAISAISNSTISTVYMELGQPPFSTIVKFYFVVFLEFRCKVPVGLSPVVLNRYFHDILPFKFRSTSQLTEFSWVILTPFIYYVGHWYNRFRYIFNVTSCSIYHHLFLVGSEIIKNFPDKNRVVLSRLSYLNVLCRAFAMIWKFYARLFGFMGFSIGTRSQYLFTYCGSRSTFGYMHFWFLI